MMMLLAIAGLVLAGPNFDYDSYRLVSLRDFEAQTVLEHPDVRSLIDGKDTGFIHPVAKLRFPVVFSGRSRRLSGFRDQTIQGWLRMNWEALANGGFQREVEVTDGETVAWLPIQEAIWPYFEREVKAGARVLVYVGFIGATNGEFVYLLGEFRAYEQTPAKPPPAKPN